MHSTKRPVEKAHRNNSIQLRHVNLCSPTFIQLHKKQIWIQGSVISSRRAHVEIQRLAALRELSLRYHVHVIRITARFPKSVRACKPCAILT